MVYVRWVIAHPGEVGSFLALITIVMRVLYAIVSRVVKPYPRLRAIVEAVAALSPDVLRAIVQTLRALTGREFASPLIDARDAQIALLRAENESLKIRAASLIAADVERTSVVRMTGT